MLTPLVHTIPEACEKSRTGRTALYAAIRSGELRAVKRGRRTLILDEDLHRWVQAFPPVNDRNHQSSNEGVSND
jgi:excisionase family DNA binding protein